MIPRPKNSLYDFQKMKVEDFIKARSYKHAVSIYNTGTRRGYNLCIRTVNCEIRVYLAGKQ